MVAEIFRKDAHERMKRVVARRINRDPSVVADAADGLIEAAEILVRSYAFGPEPGKNPERAALCPVRSEIDHEDRSFIAVRSCDDENAQDFPAVPKSGFDVCQFERFQQVTIPLPTIAFS